MKYIIILLLTSILMLILISGCSQQITQSNSTTNETFKIKYYAHHESSAGDRILDINYTVKNGEIISCEGNYTTDLSGTGLLNFPCDVEKLKIKDYNVPIILITNLSQYNQTGEVHNGPEWYRWEILEP